MQDWTAGYVADIGYTYGYYTELNPLRVKLAFLNAGLRFPETGTACELGFGQGLSVNIHATAAVTQWHGTDFNPSQAGFARELATASGGGARLYDDAFADFATKPDLPDFDFIGVHGIWSWISDANRAVIVDFVRRKLKVGGVLYISYNTLPGWAAFAPMRHLMTEHATMMGCQGQGIVPRIEGALDFCDKLLAVEPLFAKANPQIGERFKKLAEQNRHYLAHEYFNRDWEPMHFRTMAEWLSPAKLDYACSAHYLDHVDALNLTAAQQAFLQGIPDRLFRESVRDFMVNQQFRRDYWVKGARRLNALEQAETLRQQRVVLLTHRADVSLKVAGALGEASLNETIYAPILDALADHKPKTIGQIEQAVAGKDLNFAQLMQAVMVLAGSGQIAAAQDEATIGKARKQTDKLNAHLMQKSRGSTDVSYLASPVTGGGTGVNRFKQLFLLAKASGRKTPEDWAGTVWQLLSAHNQRLIKDGATLESPEDNLAELTAQAREFAAKELPILHALGIA
ncbi:Methyltransferase regulatory domain-containing protein (plasmid) [Solidesulfovibrio carbinoliphilus subsp. oakridgensis]|uniref:Methyltransferase regulatory domain-containing protein n=1 Tax=Solidesulfovibrio carbinoliphilus subsp. oakridgensis TaxID=694327 RepID=G7QEC0_9BACT|nr:class I SAM-dependent methyltransferase [Solidesulfovibrio carbinoliphilus]EHJ46014.1 Methyltransferase regulatory domain-containing protein [Solidesulfovibrio carbinoliphilus subsp. oakridgensis]